LRTDRHEHDLKRHESGETPKWLAKPTAAKYLDCTTAYIERLIAQGEIPYHRIGRKFIRISRDDLDDFVAAGRVEPEIARTL